MMGDLTVWQAFLVLVAGAVVLGMVWTGWRVRNARRVWREVANRSQGRCEQCGYDLRATPKPGAGFLPRCPECGHVPSRGNG